MSGDILKGEKLTATYLGRPSAAIMFLLLLLLLLLLLFVVLLLLQEVVVLSFLFGGNEFQNKIKPKRVSTGS
jgi:1,4-dihydroxy-2-naphthoate octaprenyltransferase